MVTAVYPGTFDPITNGHLDIIQRGARLFDRLIIAIAANHNKSPLFTAEERLKMIRQTLDECHWSTTISVTTFDHLLVDFCRENQASVILRGLRAVSDFEYEFQLSGMNKQLNPAIETLFLPTCEKYAHLSSSLVKEVARLSGDIKSFVPANVKADILKKIR